MAAADNYSSGRNLTELLFLHSSEPIITTNVLVPAAANVSPESDFSILKAVLKHLRHNDSINEDVLVSAIGNITFWKENPQLLLARSTNENIDTVMLKAATVFETPLRHKEYSSTARQGTHQLYCLKNRHKVLTEASSC